MNKFSFEVYIPTVIAYLEDMIDDDETRPLLNKLKKDLADRLEQIESAKEGLTWLAG